MIAATNLIVRPYTGPVLPSRKVLRREAPFF